jgi:nicotinate phosphoribosyltransferase
LKQNFNELSRLFLQKNERDWVIENIPYIPQYYWEWLSGFRYEPNKIKVWLDDEKHLHIEVTDLMYKVTFYEIPILAIVSD